MLRRVSHSLQCSVADLETRTCSTPHRFPHHVMKCACQIWTGLYGFCRELGALPISTLASSQDILQRAITLQKACRTLCIPMHWSDTSVRSYIQTGRPYTMMMCTDPHVIALVADRQGQELCLLLRAYTMFGILGELPDWQSVSGLSLHLSKPTVRS